MSDKAAARVMLDDHIQIRVQLMADRLSMSVCEIFEARAHAMKGIIAAELSRFDFEEEVRTAVADELKNMRGHVRSAVSSAIRQELWQRIDELCAKEVKIVSDAIIKDKLRRDL